MKFNIEGPLRHKIWYSYAIFIEYLEWRPSLYKLIIMHAHEVNLPVQNSANVMAV